MAQVPSQLSIISGAAQRLGEPPVVSLSEDTVAAKTGANLYDTVLESTLTMHDWRFAQDQIELNLLAGEPLNERFKYAYQIPTDPKILKIRRLYPWQRSYDRYGMQIHCDHPSGLTIDCIVVPSPERFTPAFVELMEARMAQVMALPVTGKQTLKDSMGDDIIGVGSQPGLLAIAMAVDSQQQPQEPIVDSPFTDGRR